MTPRAASVESARRAAQHAVGVGRRLLGRFVEPSREPVFVVGNQRSGTSVIAQLMGEMAGLSTAIDLYDEMIRPSYHEVLAGTLDIASFVDKNRLDFSRDLVKEPNLTFLCDELARFFPRAQTVFVVRDPRDNIRSILNRLQVPGDLADLDHRAFAAITPAWRMILDSAGAALPDGNYIARLAHRWVRMARVYRDHEESMVLIRYEDFVQDKEESLRQLVRQVGRAPAHDVTARLDVQFQRPGDAAVPLQEFFGQQNLEAIEAVCASEMRFFGYPP
ncbi:MAG: sulfotransferase family protein [Egibacteraceae bacterium]